MSEKSENIYKITKEAFDKQWDADTLLDNKVNDLRTLIITTLGVLTGLFTLFHLDNILTSFPEVISSIIISLTVFGSSFLFLSLFNCFRFFTFEKRIFGPSIKEENIDKVEDVERTLIISSKMYAMFTEDLYESNEKKRKPY